MKGVVKMPKKGNTYIDISDIIGSEIGNWKVLEYDHKELDYTNGGCKVRHWYKCRCSCGREKSVRRDSLLQEKSLSCGCRKGFR